MHVGVAFVDRALSCSGCIIGQHQIPEHTSKANFIWYSLRNSHVFQCPLLLPADIVGVRHETAVDSCLVGNKHWIATNQMIVDRGAMLAFSGVAAIGHAANAFKTMDIATALLLMQMLPVELIT